MILDTCSNLARYCALHPLFPAAADFLRRPDLAALPDGRYEIDGDRLFALVMRAEGRAPQAAELEVHDRYIDIQLLLDGSERMGWRPRSTCRQAVGDFDRDKDILFYRDAPDAWVDLRPGQLVVFFPEDAHAPMVSTGLIHKVVVKIATQPLT